ncbi:MAG: cyclic nucleotide-binding domain-containing protein [Oligoflexia bacterium]|nr:cyclic nucleotide-binding domain-containing protein [Oligoflexia bacterium]
MLEVFFENFFKKEKEGEAKMIQNCPLFSDLTNKEMSFLTSLLHHRIYADGEIVFKPSSGTGMYIILKGRVNILQGQPNSQEESSLISSLKEGHFFGELSLVYKKAYQSMFAQSAGDSKLLGFFQPDLKLILENYPKMGIKILTKISEILSNRLQKAEQKILQIHSSK